MPLLAFNLNDGNEFVFDLTEEVMGLGRASDNTIIINNSYISGHHAEFRRREDGAYELRDLQSANGVRVNGEKVERAVLKDLDKVAFGQLEGRYYQEGTLAGGGSGKVTAGMGVPEERKVPGVLAQLRAGAGGIPRTGVTVPGGSSAAVTRGLPVEPVPLQPVPIRKLRPEDFSGPKALEEPEVKGGARGAGMNGKTVPLAEVNAELERERVIAERKLEEIEEKLNRRADELLEIEKAIAELGDREERLKALGLGIAEDEKRREALREEMAAMEVEVAGRKEAVREMEKAREKVAEEAEALGKLAAERAEAEVAVKYLEEKQRKLEERVGELDRLHETGRLAEERKAAMEEEAKGVEGRIAALKAEAAALAAVREAGEEAGAALKGLLDEEVRLREEVGELRKDREALRGEREVLSAVAAELEAKRGELAETEARLEEVVRKEAQFGEEKEAKSGAMEELRGEEFALRSEVESLRAEAKALAGMREAAEAAGVELKELGKTLEAREKRLGEMGERERELAGKVEAGEKELRERLGELEAEVEERRVALSDVVRELDKLRGEKEELAGLGGKLAAARSEVGAVEARVLQLREEEELLKRGVEAEKARMGEEVEKLHGEELALRGILAGLAAERDAVSDLEGEKAVLEERLKVLRVEVGQGEREEAERAVAEAVNAVRYAAGISPDEDPARVLEGRVAEAAAEAKRLREEAEEEVATMKMHAARYGKKSREFRRMEKEIRRGEKRLVVLERKAMRTAERAAVAEAVRSEEKGLRRALEDTRREVEQTERSLKYLKEREGREKGVVAEVEEELAKLEGMRREVEGEIEKARKEMANLPEEGQKLRDIRLAVTAEEARMADLKVEAEELEERRRLMEVAVDLEEATVLLLGRELIKRVDLVDTMVNHYRYYEANPGVETQLGTFRASLTDMLKESSIWELAPAPGTPVDIRLRKQMKIVETDGSDVSKIVETIRPGYVYQSKEGGREIVLRKVEVRTG